MSHPVLVILITKNCYFCENLLKIWDQVIKSMLSIYPQLRFPSSTVDTIKFQHPPLYVHNNTINYNLFPKDLSNYILWYPFIMLIPGDSWDQCNLNLGVNNTTKLQNVQIMNSVITNDIIKPFNKYNITKPENFGLWLKEALQNISKIPKSLSNPFLKQIEKGQFIDHDTILNIVSR